MGKKGITLVELIISIALISLVILFLFQLLIEVKNSDNRIDYARDNQQTRAVIIKTVQDDFLDYGLVGLNDAGSTNNKFVVNFTFKDGKTSILTVENNTVTYKNVDNETEKWKLEPTSAQRKYNVRCVEYNLDGFSEDDMGDFFSVWFKIPLEAKKNSKNIIDDLEFFYIGKKLDLNLNTNPFPMNTSTLGRC